MSIRIDDLTVTFKNGVTAVDHVDLEIPHGVPPLNLMIIVFGVEGRSFMHKHFSAPDPNMDL